MLQQDGVSHASRTSSLLSTAEQKENMKSSVTSTRTHFQLACSSVSKKHSDSPVFYVTSLLYKINASTIRSPYHYIIHYSFNWSNATGYIAYSWPGDKVQPHHCKACCYALTNESSVSQIDPTHSLVSPKYPNAKYA